MKTISLWQPWASLIAIGAKKIETRSWDANYTGPIAIHASKRWTPEQRLFSNSYDCGKALHGEIYFDIAGRTDHTLPLGKVIAVCHLDRVIPILRGGDHGYLADKTIVNYPEFGFGDYGPGRFAWMLSNVIKLAEPVPWKGMQKWFEVPDELLK